MLLLKSDAVVGLVGRHTNEKRVIVQFQSLFIHTLTI
jgi:hypothetical protein